MQDKQCAIIAFARAPVVGKVKTRLAAGVGQEGALEVYKACAAHVLAEASGCARFFCVIVKWVWLQSAHMAIL